MKKITFFAFLLIFNTYTFTQTNLDSLKKHVKFLASDQLQGRLSGTIYERMAAEYIKNSFKNSQLTPLFDNGFQVFEIWTNDSITHSEVKINKINLTSSDYEISVFSPDANFHGEIVFAGYGISINDSVLYYDDYKNIDVKDKAVLIIDGLPNNKLIDKNKHKNYGEYQTKIKTAIQKGAKVVIIISLSDSTLLCNQARYKISYEIPVIQLKNSGFEKIFKTKKQKLIRKWLKSPKEVGNIDLIISKESIYKNGINICFAKIVDKNAPYIIVGAHYDHLGLGGCNSGSKTPNILAIHNGADDNASGTAAVLEIARILSNQKTNKNYIFVTFSAEEKGLLGSQYFVKNLPVPKNQIQIMINFDMIGGGEKTLSIIGTGSGKYVDSLLKSTPNDTNKLLIKLSHGISAGSDHYSFYADSIPALFFYSSKAKYYHTPSDDYETLNFENFQNVVEFTLKFINILDNFEQKIEFQKIPSNTTNKYSPKIRLGIVPSFEGNVKGLKISGFTENSPAQKAGIKPNDIIIKINNFDISNLEDYTQALSTLEKGQKTTIVVNREGETLKFIVEL